MSSVKQQWIELAAKLIEEDQLSPQQAIARAKKQLRVAEHGSPPRVQDVLAAARMRLELFQPQSTQLLQRMLDAVSEALPFFAEFHPHIIGAFAQGVATVNTAIQIELLCEHVDQVYDKLMQLKIPAQQKQDRLQTTTWFEFRAGEFAYHIYALTSLEQRDPKGIDIAKLKQSVMASSKLQSTIADQEHRPAR